MSQKPVPKAPAEPIHWGKVAKGVAIVLGVAVAAVALGVVGYAAFHALAGTLAAHTGIAGFFSQFGGYLSGLGHGMWSTLFGTHAAAVATTGSAAGVVAIGTGGAVMLDHMHSAHTTVGMSDHVGAAQQVGGAETGQDMGHIYSNSGKMGTHVADDSRDDYNRRRVAATGRSEGSWADTVGRRQPAPVESRNSSHTQQVIDEKQIASLSEPNRA